MCIIHTLTCLKKFVHLHLSKYYVITAKKRLRICRDISVMKQPIIMNARLLSLWFWLYSVIMN